MSDTKDCNLTYTGISLGNQGVAALSTVIGELAEKNIDHTLLYFWINDDWSVYETPKAITSICWSKEKIQETYCLSADGHIITISDDGEKSIQIDNGDEGPSDLVIMKDICFIEDSYYAVGMARHVYKSKLPKLKWGNIDSSCFVPRVNRKSVIGFSSIDGFNAEECYAVGYEGEIWRFDGISWIQEQSPTNIFLSKVICDRRKGIVWIVGLAGVVIVGRYSEWRILHQTTTRNDFWGVEVFADSVFISGDDGVFKVDRDDLRVCLLDKKRRKLTTGYLASSSEELWSVGDKDIYRTKDGSGWERIPAP